MLKSFTAVIVLMTLHIAVTGHTALIIVNNHQDLGVIDGNCDLRDAIEAANTNTVVDACAAGDSITIDSILIQANQAIQLIDDITITGSVLILTDFGAPPQKILAASGERIFTVRVNAVNDSRISMQNLHLMNGSPCCAVISGSGGAILFDGTQNPMSRIKLNNMVFEDNTALNGGAINIIRTYSSSVEITNSTFINNTSTSNGGALFGSDLIGGSSQADGFNMQDNVFMSNQAGSAAGAVYLADAFGGVPMVSSGNVYLANSSDSNGGAIRINDNNNQDYELTTELFMFNEAAVNGGAISVGLSSRVNIEKSMMLFNTASSGGGLGSTTGTSQTTLKNSTLAHNSASQAGDNLSNTNSGFQLLRNIIASPSNGDNCSGPLGTDINQSMQNLVDDNSCEMLSGTMELIVADPKLSGFSSHPDELPGFRPTASSQAIDFYACTPGSVDFYGNPRPTDGDGDGTALCDLGAVEVPADFDVIWSDAFGL